MGGTHVTEPGLWERFVALLMSLSVALLANALLLPASAATADPPPKPAVVDADPLTAKQITDQVKAAEALRAALMKSSAEVSGSRNRSRV